MNTRKDAVKRLEELYSLYNETTAAHAYAEAHNLILDSELFISDELQPILNDLKLKISGLLTKYRLGKHVGRNQMIKWVEDEQVLEKEIPELMSKITARIKAELTYAINLKDKSIF